MKKDNDSWTTSKSSDLYGIEGWGVDYFSASDKGEICVSKSGSQGSPKLALLDIVKDMKDRGMNMPALIRFEDLLEQQIVNINEAFSHAINEQGYKSVYRGVFPIKVNQQCHVIEEIAAVGEKYHHGLEAGSKPELIIALAHMNPGDSCIVCNGYKDSEFIDLGLQARRMGYNCFFVIETPTELPIILQRSRELGIKPRIGVRVKLASMVSGHWNSASGDRSIFGLSIAQLVDLIDQLKKEDMLDCLELLHYHLGSQIPNIRDIRSGVLEACQVYMDLIREGANMRYLDLGGGLAVDYDGSKSNDTHSKNYSLSEYCSDIVDVIIRTLDPHNIDHPIIVTESGRATIAYSSILVFNVLDVATSDPSHAPTELAEDSHTLVKELWDCAEIVNKQNFQECYNDSVFYRDEIRALFKRGQVSLRMRSIAENLFLVVINKIKDIITTLDIPRKPSEYEKLREQMADIYYCNFSLFQSLPDVWAIDQIFPIAPIHRLNEKPTRDAIIADITCDCDGRIDRFSNMQETSSILPLHPVINGEEYYIGVFLVGAYQETLGDLHNLFGDPNVVSVRIHDDGSYEFADEIEGDSIADVLSYVEYQPQALKERFRKRAELAVKQGKINAKDRQKIMKAFSESLLGYTYYETEH